MTLFRNRYRIESARLRGFDYATPGEYFVTVGTASVVELFGRVTNGIMIRSDLGETAHRFLGGTSETIQESGQEENSAGKLV
jgi:hypothetical protein